MTREKIISLLEAVGCRKIRSGIKHVKATCPNEVLHSKGVDRNPSLSVFINNTGGSYFRCFSCGFDGILEIKAREWGFEGYDSEEFLMNSNYRKRLDSLGEYCGNLNLKHWGRRVDDGYYDYLPEFSIKRFTGRCPRYIVKRGITIESAKRWNIGYDEENKRAIFIIRDFMNRLCGVSGRSVIDHNIKYSHYSWDIKNYKLEPFIDHEREKDFLRFKKSNFLFGEHLVDYSRGDIIFVEGHIDAIKVDQCGINAVALMGTQFNDSQIKKIRDLVPNGKFAVLMLDGDKAGKEATKKLEKDLDGILIKKVKLPDDTDPGDFGECDLIGFINKATIF